MPPKASKKAKEVTPEPKPKAKVKPNATPTKPTPSKTTPKKVKEPPTYKQLTKDNTGDATPVEVSFEGDSIQAKVKKTGGFGHVLKLDSSASFTLLKNVMLTEGPHEGHQAIIIRPAKAFEFLKLTKEIQARVYEYYFAQKGVVGETIVLDGKRANKEIYAKTFAEGSKTRVGLLAVNKEVYTDALPIFYAHTLKFESTTTLLDFLSQIPTSIRPRLHSLEIKSYIKTTSRNAMHFLAEAQNLARLRIESGVYCGSEPADPVKASKAFYADAYKFLEAIAAASAFKAVGEKGDEGGRKDAGVDLLEFGRLALVCKDEKKVVRPWDLEKVEEFRECLRERLICREEMERKTWVRDLCGWWGT
ncbi:hypothetical protein D0866_11226 [Hortaea werneckii]|uniref:Uncharacterized protein n=1 Tax=Hortaea werneckii TaxID=91943 RepID=A0A3M7ABW2_HORWE|nr:hypothetical protein D0866_11226 [Hortaea werneckii]